MIKKAIGERKGKRARKMKKIIGVKTLLLSEKEGNRRRIRRGVKDKRKVRKGGGQ